VIQLVSVKFLYFLVKGLRPGTFFCRSAVEMEPSFKSTFSRACAWFFSTVLACGLL
jgi:hypothetical protein